MSFPCRRCGKCCESTEMPLTKDDVERILALGYRLEEFAEFRGGVLRLKNVDGRCVFNDPETKLCKIYEHRPVGCRLYPLVYVEGVGVALDVEVCPAAYSAPREFVERGRKLLLRVVASIVREERSTKEPLTDIAS